MSEEYSYTTTQGFNLNISINLTELPVCPKCERDNTIAKHRLLPLPDQSREGNVYLKHWVCPNCGFNIGLKSGEIVTLPISGNKREL